jgi:hypothetical protein
MIEDIKLFVINKKDWLVALLLILTGGMIYVLYRPESLLLFRVTDSLGMTPLIDIVRSNTSKVMLPSFMINSLPAGLWTASYLMMMYITTKFHTRRIRLMLALPLPVMAIVLELMQFFGWCPGTFDIYDLICYIVPLFIFIKSI